MNPDTVIYPDLISLEVSESDVLNQAAHEQASHVRPTDAAVADKVRQEVLYCLSVNITVLTNLIMICTFSFDGWRGLTVISCFTHAILTLL